MLLILLSSHCYADEVVASPPLSQESKDAIAKQEQQLAQLIKKYQKRPWRKVYGINIDNKLAEPYVKDFTQKIENISRLVLQNNPYRQNLEGSAIVTTSIKYDGSLKKVVIAKSSGNKNLDKALLDIITIAAPYSAFSDEMRAEVDILDITRTFTITHEELSNSVSIPGTVQ